MVVQCVRRRFDERYLYQCRDKEHDDCGEQSSGGGALAHLFTCALLFFAFVCLPRLRKQHYLSQGRSRFVSNTLPLRYPELSAPWLLDPIKPCDRQRRCLNPSPGKRSLARCSWTPHLTTRSANRCKGGQCQGVALTLCIVCQCDHFSPELKFRNAFCWWMLTKYSR